MGDDRRGDFVGNLIGFLVPILVQSQYDLIAFVVIGVKFLAFSPPIVPNQLVGHAENIRGAAIVLFQPNRFDRGVVFLEVEDVVQICTAPPVNRLIGNLR